jgi:serine/threonine-protein kinase RsbW
MGEDVFEVFVLSLPSKLGHEKVAMSTAASVARLMGFAEDRIEDLKTAVAEACINSIEHGNQMDESLRVGVILSMTATALEIRVWDHGTGLDANTPVPDIDSKMAGEENPRGMGMFLIQGLMDEVEWINSKQTGSCARLVIRLKKPDGK